MEKAVTILVLTACFLAVGHARDVRIQAQTSRYRHFEDYLLGEVPSQPVEEVLPQADEAPPASELEWESDDGDADGSFQAAVGDDVTNADILSYFRDVPRQHWSCCMLGRLAGEKGFHCQVRFYAARIARRNHNRPHNQQMLFHGRDAITNWGRDIMTTFSRCIDRHATQFHDCCHATTLEQRARDRWQRFRRRGLRQTPARD